MVSPRFIPARAGNTPCRLNKRFLAAVHPRSRGEYDKFANVPNFFGGSSPLARGILPRVAHDVAGRRFIPARAGNTVFFSRLSHIRPVHPRSRGEYSDWFAGNFSADGSSPLARGIPWCPIAAIE